MNGLNLYCYCFNDPVNYYDPYGNFPILGLIIGAAIGVASGAIAGASLVSGSVVNQIATSPILNTLLVKSVTDVINIGASVGATLLGYQVAKMEIKINKFLLIWLKEFWSEIRKSESGFKGGNGLPYYDPGTSITPTRPNIPSFGGEIDHHGDDGDDSWNILDDPY